MVTQTQVENQLKRVKSNYTLWGSTECAQLPRLLMDGEEIAVAVNGYYEGGFGLLVVTNLRVLIVDKKPFTFNLEDLRYEMITEVNYGARFVIATIHVSIPTRQINFSSWSMDKLHKAMQYVQQHVMDARNGGSLLPESDDWFRRQLTSKYPTQSVRSSARLARISKSVLSMHDRMSQSKPQIYDNHISQRAINPYAKLPSLERRRRYPSFYNI